MSEQKEEQAVAPQSDAPTNKGKGKAVDAVAEDRAMDEEEESSEDDAVEEDIVRSCAYRIIQCHC